MGLWYNPTITLAFFESKGYTQLVFKTIMQMLPSMKSDFEKKRMIFGLSSILKLNPYQIPQVSESFFLIGLISSLFSSFNKTSRNFSKSLLY